MLHGETESGLNVPGYLAYQKELGNVFFGCLRGIHIYRPQLCEGKSAPLFKTT